MSFKIKEIDLGPPFVAVVEAVGLADSSAVDAISDLKFECLRKNVRFVVIDFSKVVSVDKLVVDILMSFYAQLRDRAGELHLVEDSKVVHWFFEYSIGKMPIKIHNNLNVAVEAISGSSLEPSFGVGLGNPQTVQQWQQLLKQSGLCVGSAIFVVKNNLLSNLEAEEIQIKSCSDLANKLLNLTVVESMPPEIESYSLYERAFIRRCNADIVVPMPQSGVLILRSGRVGGILEYRSGELLALQLIAKSISDQLKSTVFPKKCNDLITLT